MADFSIKKLPELAKKGFHEIKDHWSVPAPGKYAPYKEWVAVTVAVGGEESHGHGLTPFGFGMGNVLTQMIYQVPTQYFPMIGLITGPIGYLWSIIGMILDDNLGHVSRKLARIINIIYIPLFLAGLAMLLFVPITAQERILPGFWKYIGANLVANVWRAWRQVFWRRLLLEKVGRYKMWAYVNLVPAVLCLALIAFLPFNQMPIPQRAWILNLLFSFYAMYPLGGHANNVARVMTPNEQERVAILAYPGTISNGINSILGFLLPAMAGLVGGNNTLGYYRYILPIGIFLGLVMQYPALSRLKERIPQPPVKYKPAINFWSGCDAVLRNKYNWIKTISGVIDNLGTGALGIMTVLFVYYLRETDWINSLLNTLLMTAVTPGILLSPLFNKIDYRKMYFITRGMSILTQSAAYIALLLGLTNPIVFAIIVLSTQWFATLFSRGMTVIGNVMDTNLGDYQMWISGERMESFKTIFGWFTGPFFTMMAFMVPLMFKNIGFTSNWDVLYIDDVRVKLLMAGCLLVIGGDIVSMLPYIAFKFPKAQHRQIIKDLEWRAQAAMDLEPVNEAALHGGDPEAVLAQVIAARAAQEAAGES